MKTISLLYINKNSKLFSTERITDFFFKEIIWQNIYFTTYTAEITHFLSSKYSCIKNDEEGKLKC